MKARLKQRRMGPEPISADGQPGHGRVTTPSPGQAKQPGHRQGHDHPKTGVAKPDVSVVTPAAKPKTVKHLIRQHAPASHHTLMTTGVGMHPSGQPSHGPTDAAYAQPARGVPQHAGKPEVAGQGAVGGANPRPNLTQDRVHSYGSVSRFKKLRMTPKMGGGAY